MFRLLSNTFSKMGWNLFILFIIILFTVSSTDRIVVNSQQQDDFKPFCEPYQSNSLCNDYLAYNSIFIQDKNKTQQDLYLQVYKELSYLDQTKCNIEVALKFLCKNFFQECIIVEESTVLPNRVCDSQCRDTVKECPGVMGGNINCKEERMQLPENIGATGEIYKYPYHANLWTLSSPSSDMIKANIECETGQLTVVTKFGQFQTPTTKSTAVAATTESKEPTPSASSSSGERIMTSSELYNQDPNAEILIIPYCPLPLLYRNGSNREYEEKIGYRYVGDTPCIFDCPSPFYSREEWSKFDKMVKAVGIVSFCTSLVVIVTYSIGLYVQRDQRHTISILCIAFGIFLIMLTDVVYAHRGFDMLCPERGRYATQQDPGCASTGMIFQFGSVFAVLFWSVFSFDLWLSLKKIKGIKNLKYIYLVVITVLSILLTFIPVVGNQYGYGFGGLGCWIMDFNWQLIFFWIPLSICLLIGTIFIALILFEIKKIVSAANQKRKRALLKYHLKPVLAIIFICAEFFYLLIYNAYIQSNTTLFEEKITDYVLCLMVGTIDKSGGVNCSLETISFPAQFTFLFFLRLLGIECMIFFVWSTQSRKIWNQTIFFKKIGILRDLLKKSSKESSCSNATSCSTSPNTFQMTPTATFGSQDDSGLGDSGGFKLDSSFRLEDSQERLTMTPNGANGTISPTATENNNDNSTTPTETSSNNSIENSNNNIVLNQVISISEGNIDNNNNNNHNDQDGDPISGDPNHPTIGDDNT